MSWNGKTERRNPNSARPIVNTVAWLQWDPLGAVGAVIMVLLFAVAAFVLFSAPGRPANRWLAPLLVLEAFPGEGGFVARLLTDPGMQYAAEYGVAEPSGAAFMFLLLGFLGVALETPLVYPLRRPIVQRFLVIAAILSAAVIVFVPGAWTFGRTLGLVTMAVLLFSVVAAIDAYRRTPPGTLIRKRAGAYLLAFGTRDLAIFWAIAPSIVGGDQPASWSLIWITLTLLYLGFLLYGILKTQLFDIDLKLRWTVQKGTVAAIFLAVFFVAMQLAENALNQRFGWIWGGIGAGLLLFALAPIMRIAERISKAAVPQAKPLDGLTGDERSAFYADHVRAAWEDGSLDRSDRALLNTLRNRLGLPIDTAARLELEITSQA